MIPRKFVAPGLAATALVGLALAFVPAVSAQDAASANGMFTAEQAARAEAVYARSCASCHGDTLGGGASAPPLSGFPFTSYWASRPLGELHEYTKMNMPQDNPGSLTAEQYADLTALMLAKSGYAAGEAELTTDVEAQKQVTIGEPANAQ